MRHFFLVLALLVITACGTSPYNGTDAASASFLERAITQEQDGLSVSAAVPDAQETIALTGLDLYSQGIQPVWIEITNTTDSLARVATWSIDREYFSPIEVAYMNRKKFSSQGYADMERWFLENGLQRFVPPGEVARGLVFTHLKRGTKGFNLNLFHDGSAVDLTFFVPLPGFVADFMLVDFKHLYAESEIRHLDHNGLRQVLENELGCCAVDETGELEGGPLNTVLVGTGMAVRRAMLRGGWLETSAEEGVAQRAREQKYQQRQPDAIFTQLRGDGNERIQLHLWMAPWLVDDEPVWLGQVFYFSSEKSVLGLFAHDVVWDDQFKALFAEESISADLDSAQRFLFQNLWYNGSLRLTGYVEGVGKSSLEQPRVGFGGGAYVTDGRRYVAFLSEAPVALDEAQIVYKRSRYEVGEGATPVLFQGKQVPSPNDRLHSQKDGHLTIATAVPSAAETKELFAQDLYAKNIQPVWVQVENQGDSTVFLTPMGIDPAYFTARETANRFRKDLARGHTKQYEDKGHSTMAVAPGSIQSGYIFTRVDEGTKSFNVDVIGDGKAHQLSFYVPVPGLKLDHHEVNIAEMYPASEVKDVNLEELVVELENMPCCVRDSKGKGKGDPLNLVFVGEAKDLYYAFMRAGWDETETIYRASLLKTAASAITGGSYRYSPVSALYVFGRSQDAAMQRARGSINERNHLRIWITPLRLEGEPVWIGQISRDIGVHFTWKTITTHKIDPNVDETREYLLEDLAYSQALKKFGYIGGVGQAPYEKPRGNLTGDPYFTDGKRVVMWISGEPTGLDDVQPLDLSPYHTGVVGP